MRWKTFCWILFLVEFAILRTEGIDQDENFITTTEVELETFGVFEDPGATTQIPILLDQLENTESAEHTPEVDRANINEICGISNQQLFSNKRFQKITGGFTAPFGLFPWMVAILSKTGKVTCGGTLINADTVLTASHCLASYSPKDLSQLTLLIGDYNIKSTKDGPHEIRRVQSAIVHSKFNIGTYHNDVALLKMDHPVNFTDRIRPICLPPITPGETAASDISGTVVVAGWGRERKWGNESPILKMVEMPVWNIQECARVYKIFAPGRIIPQMNICAGDGKKSRDACIGDSGGPLMKKVNGKWVQFGIVSWGKGCGSFPGVYTNLKTFVEWINKKLN